MMSGFFGIYCLIFEFIIHSMIINFSGTIISLAYFSKLVTGCLFSKSFLSWISFWSFFLLHCDLITSICSHISKFGALFLWHQSSTISSRELEFYMIFLWLNISYTANFKMWFGFFSFFCTRKDIFLSTFILENSVIEMARCV